MRIDENLKNGRPFDLKGASVMVQYVTTIERELHHHDTDTMTECE